MLNNFAALKNRQLLSRAISDVGNQKKTFETTIKNLIDETETNIISKNPLNQTISNDESKQKSEIK